MENESNRLDMFFLPLVLQGHMIPMTDIAKTFETRGAKVTIVTTPFCATLFAKQIERVNQLGLEFDIQTVKFPSTEVGLPEGWENLDAVAWSQNQAELLDKFWKALSLLRELVFHILEEHRPDCLVADLFFPWATDVASRLKIPRLVFGGTSFFATCVAGIIALYQPHKRVSSDSETFLVPHLPGEIKLTRTQLQEYLRQEVETEFSKFAKQIVESEVKSYGSIFNSFYELDKDYADYYRNILGRKAWLIGPVSLCNRDTVDKALRGKEASISRHECLKWLDSKKANSVIYVCFGSLTKFNSQQLVELAKGLEASQQDFIWIVRKDKSEEQDWLPKGFEERMDGKSLIIRGWAPQVLILDHESVGGFVTHCGWNSTMEGVCAGVPMVTWPIFSEQFYNEKLVTQLLQIGIGVGSKQNANFGVGADVVSGDDIVVAVRRVMAGEEAEEMRRRAKKLGEMARKAVGEGGSSDLDLTSLIEELMQHKAARESK
ncbi:scopoletin glucosyltransferase-like [Rhodamnia argentea]|uniref:Glycosyltransferase n=1 Tax=Rhodamnia argentea TaxID=178133 RepID=A0A8B8NKK1_9MYRT|nr:scopoletin glucosyltransferase-like [Rhodamnia argentea]